MITTKWELKYVATDDLDTPLLTQFGDEGWEPYAVTTIKMTTNQFQKPKEFVVFFFKRPKSSTLT